MRSPLAVTVALLIASSVLPSVASAQEAYREPPSPVRELLRSPPTPLTYVSPNGRWVWAASVAQYPPVAQLAAPMLRLAGVRLDPRTNGPHAWSHLLGGITLRRLPDGAEVAVRGLAKHVKFGAPTWNADASRFAFVSIADTAIELWIVDVARATARKVGGLAVNPLLGSQLQWMPDGKSLLVKTVPLRRGAAPAEPPPVGPIIQDATAVTIASSTYEARDLLRTPHDAALFTHYATSQLALVDAATLKVKRIGKPAVFGSVRTAPDGLHLLVQRIKTPYSFARPWNRFPRDLELWKRDGTVVETVASLPLADQVPVDGVPTGPRDHRFDPTAPATLVWTEALDQGDWAVKVARRDRIMRKELGKPAVAWMDTEYRCDDLAWIEDSDLVLVMESERDRRWARVHVATIAGKQPTRTLVDRSLNDAYGDPGTPVYDVLPTGGTVVRRDGNAIYLKGDGATPGGNRPFLDRIDLTTLKAERLWRSTPARLERFVEWHDVAAGTFVTSGQSPTEPANLELRTLGAAVTRPASGEAALASTVRALTHFPDPTPQIRGVTKQLVTTKRADGVQVTFTLYLPPGYTKGTRLPTVFWAYPLEYSDPGTAGQVVATPTSFTSPRGAAVELFTLAGYAVIDVSMPVVGPPETVYDSFVEQIVANARAAIDKAVELGVTDRDRVGVGGHSHGALMTANLLAYSDLFRAGIARSGAFNHTLRPFSFQSEHRSFFAARATYLKLSPTLNADKIDEPLLIIHGAVDVNPGTVPLQSEKLFEAVRGTGGTTRLVMLPFESHGYVARESVEHVVAEQIEWFDRYVKAARPRPVKAGAGSAPRR